MNYQEPDDALHNPTVRGGKVVDDEAISFSKRGIANVGCLMVLCLGLLALLSVPLSVSVAAFDRNRNSIVYPVLTYVQEQTSSSSFLNLGVNASGQVSYSQCFRCQCINVLII